MSFAGGIHESRCQRLSTHPRLARVELNIDFDRSSQLVLVTDSGFAARSSFRDFDLSRDESLRKLEIPVPSIDGMHCERWLA